MSNKDTAGIELTDQGSQEEAEAIEHYHNCVCISNEIGI